MKTTPKRVLFKPARGWAGRVVLNWESEPKRDLERMAEAYQLVAHERVEFLKSQNAPRIYPDVAYQAFPIVFLYRQSFELILKAIVFAGRNLLLDEGEEPMATKKIMRHPLMPLFEEVSRILDRWQPGYTQNWDHLPPELLGPPELRTWSDFEAIVREFDEFDRWADTFRFSVKTDGTTSTLPAEGFDFDLFDFSAIMDQIVSALIDIPAHLREELQERWRAE